MPLVAETGMLQREGIIDVGKEFFAHAHAVVPHIKAETCFLIPLGNGFLDQGNLSAFRGELYGVGEQVEKDLMKAERIGQDTVRGYR